MEKTCIIMLPNPKTLNPCHTSLERQEPPRAHLGIMEKKNEATIGIWGIYWGYVGRMEKNMETAIGFRI